MPIEKIVSQRIGAKIKETNLTKIFGRFLKKA